MDSNIHTGLHNICNQIMGGFNNPRPPQHTLAIALDMSKLFDAVNIHKPKLTNIPNTIIKFIENYIRGRQAFTQYHGTLSKLKQTNAEVPQGGVLSPTLFNIYTFDILSSPKRRTNHKIC